MTNEPNDTKVSSTGIFMDTNYRVIPLNHSDCLTVKFNTQAHKAIAEECGHFMQWFSLEVLMEMQYFTSEFSNYNENLFKVWKSTSGCPVLKTWSPGWHEVWKIFLILKWIKWILSSRMNQYFLSLVIESERNYLYYRGCIPSRVRSCEVCTVSCLVWVFFSSRSFETPVPLTNAALW